jgi:hypothetical protein
MPAGPIDFSEQRQREIGQRQSLFREVNERIERLSERFAVGDAIRIVCECGSSGCSEAIELTAAQYEELRLIPTHFAVIRGHEIPAVERVVEEHELFVVVEKLGEGAIDAIKLDPRRAR